MSFTEIVREFWGVIFVFTLLLIAGCYFLFFIMKEGVKGLVFIGKDVEEVGVIQGGPDRPEDSITVYKLTDKQSREISWCLNVVTRSRKFHGAGRVAGEIPLTLLQHEMADIIATFEKYRG
jgi:hypothetical protein